MVWTGLHVAQHASASVFSIRCLISRELASDEACWQHNGRENLRRIHQMAALLWHLGQNLVDGELAARLPFSSPSFLFFLLSLPLWQNVPDLTFIKLTFGFFFSHSSLEQPSTCPTCVCFSPSVTRDRWCALHLKTVAAFPHSGWFPCTFLAKPSWIGSLTKFSFHFFSHWAVMLRWTLALQIRVLSLPVNMWLHG